MPTHYVLDTHTFVWYLEDNPKLSEPAASVFEDMDALLYLPALGVLEASNMVRKTRTMLTNDELLAGIKNEARMSILVTDFAVAAIASTFIELTGLHDRAIVASAMQLQAEVPSELVRLVSSDREINSCDRVTVIW